jgi:hypothetical protein
MPVSVEPEGPRTAPAPLLHRPRLEVFDQHIALRCETPDQILSGRQLQIDRH